MSTTTNIILEIRNPMITALIEDALIMGFFDIAIILAVVAVLALAFCSLRLSERTYARRPRRLVTAIAINSVMRAKTHN